MDKKKRIWLGIGIAAAIGLVCCLFLFQRLTQPTLLPDDVRQPDTSQHDPVELDLEENPLNWQELQALNEDIYAWIELPGTELAQPIVQRFGDDSYYLRRDVYGNYSAPGTVFTEFQYNSTTFDDPVTLVYGHDMTNGTMFGPLQDYVPQLTLDENAVFYIYQPERRLTYQIFAAVPYDNSHILYYNDFTKEEEFNQFFQEALSIRDLRANVNTQAMPEAGDKVVILSTCVRGDNTHRYLVMGKRIEEVPLQSTLS